jgi:hypothetical protein
LAEKRVELTGIGKVCFDLPSRSVIRDFRKTISIDVGDCDVKGSIGGQISCQRAADEPGTKYQYSHGDSSCFSTMMCKKGLPKRMEVLRGR